MRGARVHVLGVDLVALRDDVHERHRVAAPEAVVLAEPRDDLAGLRARAEALRGRELDELPRREPGLVLDVVEVCLERHGQLPSAAAAVQSRHVALDGGSDTRDEFVDARLGERRQLQHVAGDE